MFKSMKRIIKWAGKYKGRLYLGSVFSFFSSLSTAIPTMAAAYALDKAIAAYWAGEKQRIAIARAILKNAPIVILDEATAFTDPQNEDKIQKSIMALSKGKTLLVIAHRLSTIQNADQIVVLKKGRIVDCGKQEELLKRCPLYADMWKAHIGAKNWSVSEKKEVAAHV